MTDPQFKEKKIEFNLAEVEVGDGSAIEIKEVTKESVKFSTPSAADNIITETPPDLGPRYDILGLVGTGGMGTVWKVHDKELGEDFAIKVLKPELVTDETALKRFQKEANLASELTHANIAAIFGPGEDGSGRPYIIMRYVDGESLADILKREGKLSEERAMDIFSQLCEALSHSQMKGIVHRDIKPSNIIISKTESGADLVQLVDFGIARCVYDEVTKTQALTKAVDVFGSPRYMSPEQLLGEEVTAQSDIYSLGIVLYEMLTGAPPFTDENPISLIVNQLNATPDLSNVTRQVNGVLSLCLRKNVSSRPKDINLVIGLIEQRQLTSPNTIHPSEAIEASGILLPFLLVFVPVCIDNPVLTLAMSSSLLMIAFSLSWENIFHKIPYPAARKLELLLFTCGIVSLISSPLNRFISGPYSEIQYYLYTPSYVHSLGTGILATAVSILLVKSQRLQFFYQNIVNLIGKRANFTHIPNDQIRYNRLDGCLFAAIPFVYAAILSSSTLAVFFTLSSYSNFDYIYGGDFFQRNIGLAIYSLFSALLLLIAARKLTYLSFLPKPAQMMKLSCAITLILTLLFIWSIRFTEDTGIVDALRQGALSGSPRRLMSKRPTIDRHPASYLGALSLLRSGDRSLPPDLYQSIVKSDNDPLLKAAAQLHLVDKGAFTVRARVVGEPTTVLNGSLDSVFSLVQSAKSHHRYTVKEGLANTVLSAANLKFEPFTKQEILLDALQSAIEVSDVKSIQKASSLIDQIPKTERSAKLDLQKEFLLNPPRILGEKTLAERIK